MQNASDFDSRLAFPRIWRLVLHLGTETKSVCESADDASSKICIAPCSVAPAVEEHFTVVTLQRSESVDVANDRAVIGL